MRDISCAGYVAGGNCDFFSLDEAKGRRTNEQTSQAIMDRLAFTDDVSARYASMLAFPLSAKQWEAGKMDTVMSVTNRLLPWEVTGGGSTHESFPGGEQIYQLYKGAFNLGQIHYGEVCRGGLQPRQCARRHQCHTCADTFTHLVHRT